MFLKGINLYSNLIPTKYQTECIRNLAEKYNLPLIDIFDKVYNSGHVIGFNFYKDNQHPDIKLYIAIAKLFAKSLKEKYKDKINIKKDNVTEKEVYDSVNFTNKDMYVVYR